MKMRSLAARNAQVNAVATMLDKGAIHLLDSADNILAVIGFGKRAFGPASEGRATASKLTSDPDARMTGLVAKYQLVTASGEVLTEGIAGDKDTPDVELIVLSPNIQQHAEVEVESYVLEAK